MSQESPSRIVKPARWDKSPLSGVRKIIAIASGKGGVGKSTTTVNLARALAESGLRVGIVDADIYGSTIPKMLRISARAEFRDGLIIPALTDEFKIKCLSIDMMTDSSGKAVIWRAPMLVKALQQMLRGSNWGEGGDLDFLLMDMPPGTGDIHLNIVQQVPVDGAVIVTTPQEVAVQDAGKCAELFTHAGVALIGVIENMSYFISPESGDKHRIFGSGGGRELAERFGVELLGEIPIDAAISSAGDDGTPPPEHIAHIYRALAGKL